MSRSIEQKQIVQAGVAAALEVGIDKITWLMDHPPLLTEIEDQEVSNFVNQVAEDFNVFICEMQDKGRGRKAVSMARNVAIWGISELLGHSSTSAGELFGRSQYMANHAIRRINDLKVEFPALLEYTEYLAETFQEEGQDLI